jgi:biopolymer transport protein ExbB/TolQ
VSGQEASIVVLVSPFIFGLLLLGVLKFFNLYSQMRYWRRRDEKLNRRWESRWSRMNSYDD